MKITRHLSISGRVQAVGFRYYMLRKARELGVKSPLDLGGSTGQPLVARDVTATYQVPASRFS